MIERSDDVVVFCCRERGHVEHGAYRRSPTLNKSVAAHGAGVATEWRDADELCDRAARQLTELRQVGEQREGENASHPRDALQQIIALAPRRGLPHHLAEIRVGDAQLAFEERDVAFQTLLHLPLPATEDLAQTIPF